MTRFFKLTPAKVLFTIKSAIFLVMIALIASNLLISSKATPQLDEIARSIEHQEPDVLGQKTNIGEIEPRTLNQQYDRWVQIVGERPLYRDGHFMLALLAFRMNNMMRAKEHLQRVKLLDPNYSGIAKLEPYLFEGQ
jgi:hypothetical protein